MVFVSRVEQVPPSSIRRDALPESTVQTNLYDMPMKSACQKNMPTKSKNIGIFC